MATGKQAWEPGGFAERAKSRSPDDARGYNASGSAGSFQSPETPQEIHAQTFTRNAVCATVRALRSADARRHRLRQKDSQETIGQKNQKLRQKEDEQEHDQQDRADGPGPDNDYSWHVAEFRNAKQLRPEERKKGSCCAQEEETLIALPWLQPGGGNSRRM